MVKKGRERDRAAAAAASVRGGGEGLRKSQVERPSRPKWSRVKWLWKVGCEREREKESERSSLICLELKIDSYERGKRVKTPPAGCARARERRRGEAPPPGARAGASKKRASRVRGRKRGWKERIKKKSGQAQRAGERKREMCACSDGCVWRAGCV